MNFVLHHLLPFSRMFSLLEKGFDKKLELLTIDYEISPHVAWIIILVKFEA